MMQPLDSILEHTRRCIAFEPNTGCWLWMGSVSDEGYSKSTAHRTVYRRLVGPIPDGLHLDHLCRVPSCVNPQHLEPVTNPENQRRGFFATKTRCKNGHPFEGRNLVVYAPTGQRICRQCNVEAVRRYAARKKGAEPPGCARLNGERVAEIRDRYATGESLRSLGQAFGVHRATIGQIVRRETWQVGRSGK